MRFFAYDAIGNRIYPRMATSVMIRLISGKRKKRSADTQVLLRNISMGGAWIESSNPPPLQSELELSFPRQLTPGDSKTPVVVRARVVRYHFDRQDGNCCGFAVEFQAIDKDVEEFLLYLIAQLSLGMLN